MIRRHKLTSMEIQILGLFGVVAIILSYMTLKIRPVSNVKIKIEAANRTVQAFELVKNYRLEKGLPIDSINDPMESGLIGTDNNFITTEVGDLNAKLTSINPNWSAYIISILEKARVKKGDIVALSFTGSFPALNIASLIALDTYGAIPLWISSEGSSSWGANIPEMTWLKIEKLLFVNKLISNRSIASSIGGANNIGGGLPSEGRDFLIKEIQSHNVTLINTTPLSNSVNEAFSEFEKNSSGQSIKLFINIGGGILSIGTPQTGVMLNPGYNSPRKLLEFKNEPIQGLIYLFLSKGVPVLHFQNINSLAQSIKFPLAPGVTPMPGTGYIFEHQKYSVIINLIILIAFLILLTIVTFGAFERDKKKKDMV